MKQAGCAVAFMLVVVGVCFSPVQDEQDDAGGATTKHVDAKTKLMQARLKRETYGIEGKDWGVAQTAEIFTKKPHAPTPRLHALAKTVTTRALHELIIGDESPLLIDVMGGNIDPALSVRRQAAVRLSPQGRDWLNGRLQAPFDRHGAIPESTIRGLDWRELLPGSASLDGQSRC